MQVIITYLSPGEIDYNSKSLYEQAWSWPSAAVCIREPQATKLSGVE